MLILNSSMIDAVIQASDVLVADGMALDRLRNAASSREPLCNIVSIAKEILAEQGFVQIRGLPLSIARPLFLAIGTLFGEPYVDPFSDSAITDAHVRPGEPLMGNQLRRLPLHTDYSMMELPPKLTMSFCLRPDRIPEFGLLYVTDVEALCYGLEADLRIEKLQSVVFPFAARNTKEAIDVVDKPILSYDSTGKQFLVRYHRSRICQGFQHRGQTPSQVQISTMLDFEHLTDKSVQVLRPEAGDLTVIDNHRMLHGRERCSISMDSDGTTIGREMMFLFVN